MTTSSLKSRRRHDIDRTRGQFDDALGELTHRIDVPARVRDKVHGAKENRRVKVEEVKEQLPETTEAFQAEAFQAEVFETEAFQAEAFPAEAFQPEAIQAEAFQPEVFQAEASGMAGQVDPLTHALLADFPLPVALPLPVAERIEPVMAPARQRPLVIAAVLVGVLLVLTLLRRLLRSSR
ncbi:MAG: DUF3618 domain-containing protein [Pseudonocardiaceae bacterium]